jgi:hypothetical protein
MVQAHMAVPRRRDCEADEIGKILLDKSREKVSAYPIRTLPKSLLKVVGSIPR